LSHAAARVLAPLDDVCVDARTKGMPGGLPPTPLAALGGKGWNLLANDLPLPLAVLKWSAIDNNSRWMQQVLATYGVSLCPHGKTTMAPQLFRKQLDDGCWGITLSTPHQVQVARHYGISRIFLANQIVDSVFLDWLAREREADPGFEFFHLVDSPAGVAALDAAARRHRLARPFTVLVEVGSAFARTGSRTLSEVLALAEAIATVPEAATLVGVEGFEGSIRGAPGPEIESRVTDFLGLVSLAAEAIEARGLFATDEVLLSAGGSAYFDLVATILSATRIPRAKRVVLRSGCYIAHDSAMYEDLVARATERSPELVPAGRPRPALEVWTYLQSRPEPALGFLTAGKRDLSYDIHLPHPERYFRPGMAAPAPLSAGHAVTALNDQHAYLALPPDTPLAIGDRVVLGISHPCTTFDKWDVLLVVDDDYTVIDAVKTFF
jgi:D-serine dehydratase